jgi:acetyltransferase-like isoleucine patch superfamily enzyme
MKLVILLILVLSVRPLIYVFGLIVSCAVCVLKSARSRKEEAGEASSRNKADSEREPKVKRRIRNYLNGLVRYTCLETGKLPSHMMRKLIYKNVFRMKINKSAVIYGGAEIREPYRVEIGEGSIIGDEVKLDGRRSVIIGKNVNFSTGVWIWTEQHDPQCRDFSCPREGGSVTIGDRAWISCRVTILPGVKVGEGAVVAAGAVLTKDAEPYSIYAGVPAEKIGERNRDLEYFFDGEYLSFW